MFCARHSAGRVTKDGLTQVEMIPVEFLLELPETAGWKHSKEHADPVWD